MTKIIVNKSEGVKSVIQKIESAKTEKITLVVPKQSAFGEEVKNFDILREAASELGKEISVESVDENVLALSRAIFFLAFQPLFGVRGWVSDILASLSVF